MAENKKSFILYCDLINVIDHLTTLEKGKLFEHLLDYVNDKNPIMDDRMLLGTWKHIEQSLKRHLKKYEARAERSRINGALGGRPSKPKKPSGINNNPEEPKKPDTDTVTVTDTDTVSVSDSKFTPEQFLKWFNEARAKNLEKPSNINYLSEFSKLHLEILTKKYTGDDFSKAFHNICNDKWANESNNIMPKHFLNPEQFTKYLDMEVIALISKKQKKNRGWTI